jgi:hypothetical protein
MVGYKAVLMLKEQGASEATTYPYIPYIRLLCSCWSTMTGNW